MSMASPVHCFAGLSHIILLNRKQRVTVLGATSSIRSSIGINIRSHAVFTIHERPAGCNRAL